MLKALPLTRLKRPLISYARNDIAVVADIMMGFDYDDEKIIKQRYEFTDEVDPDILWVGYVTPAPNSPMWRIGMKKNWINPAKIDFRTWDFLHPVMPTDHLSIEDLGRLGSWCMREFFPSPGGSTGLWKAILISWPSSAFRM